MADYSVEDISKMLNTNPETVRRWIRAGKLRVDSTLAYGAQGISEESLNDFMSHTKEGKRRVTAYNPSTSSVVSGGVSVGAAILGFPLLSIAAGIIVDYAISSARKQKKQVDEVQTVETLKIHLQEEETRLISELRMLEQKRDEIQSAIDNVSSRLEQYRACLADTDAIEKAVKNEIDRRSELDHAGDETLE